MRLRLPPQIVAGCLRRSCLCRGRGERDCGGNRGAQDQAGRSEAVHCPASLIPCRRVVPASLSSKQRSYLPWPWTGLPSSAADACGFADLLNERSVGEIVARLTTRELEQVINIAGRSPQIYPPGAYETLKEERDRLRRSVGGRSQRCSRCKNKSMGDPKNKRE